MNNTEILQHLKTLHACEDAMKWVEQRSLSEIWADCKRGDWMLWLLYKEMIRGNADVTLQKLTAAKVLCARQVEHLMKDQRSKDALDVAEKFSRGEATREEMAAAADAADAAYAAAAAADAAYAAAYAAADAAAYAAAAADAAYAAAYAAADAADAAAYAARDKSLHRSADFVRQIFPTITILP